MSKRKPNLGRKTILSQLEKEQLTEFNMFTSSMKKNAKQFTSLLRLELERNRTSALKLSPQTGKMEQIIGANIKYGGTTWPLQGSSTMSRISTDWLTSTVISLLCVKRPWRKMSSTLPLFCPDSTYITTAMENQKATPKEAREKYSLDPSKYLGKITTAIPTTQGRNFSVGYRFSSSPAFAYNTICASLQEAPFKVISECAHKKTQERNGQQDPSRGHASLSKAALKLSLKKLKDTNLFEIS